MKLAIIDFSPIVFAQYYGHVARDEDLETTQDKIKFLQLMILTKLCDIQKQVKANKSILAFDYGSWRKQEFTYYKAKRKEKKADKALDYEIIETAMKELYPILQEETNYQCIRLYNAEADDIIAVIVDYFRDDTTLEHIYIVSSDKDFQQLTDDKVQLYDYKQDKIITCEDREVFKIKMLLSGDSSDGVPNVLSDDDVFVDTNKRQKACGEKKIQKILSEGLDNLLKDEQIKKNYERNKKMILLTKEFIPKEIWNNILAQVKAPTGKRLTSFQIINNLRKYNFDGLMSRVNDMV